MDPRIRDDINHRTPTEWYGLVTPPGWDEIVTETHLALKSLDPGYEVYQIKEKFGGLRYHCSLHGSTALDIIALAEKKSYSVCQVCGTAKEVTTQGGATLCHVHQTQRKLP